MVVKEEEERVSPFVTHQIAPSVLSLLWFLLVPSSCSSGGSIRPIVPRGSILLIQQTTMGRMTAALSACADAVATSSVSTSRSSSPTGSMCTISK